MKPRRGRKPLKPALRKRKKTIRLNPKLDALLMASGEKQIVIIERALWDYFTKEKPRGQIT